MIHRMLERPRTYAAVMGAFVMAAAMPLLAPTTAHAANACHRNNNILVTAEIKTHYPVTLHGATIKLYSERRNGAAFFQTVGARAGDIISIHRTHRVATGSAEHYWWNNSQAGSYDYCETTAPRDGLVRTERIDGAHHGVRACLRRNGNQQCASWWYADNDDDSGDIT
ncbi:hypothetical protein PV367_02445 [Streptomyces europaeiscabiei]|uniref:Secreted protein n=1 Tax=Streptomyces europaeiscabiei TaxID=146819 RepID=A0AAJ2UIE4_9ACTN|nr:hypothetical protein [Streptomyces europaeiscabiei]MDX3128683.1 hypothetical protein [Streptomyces europaeiscabiei]